MKNTWKMTVCLTVLCVGGAHGQDRVSLTSGEKKTAKAIHELLDLNGDGKADMDHLKELILESVKQAEGEKANFNSWSKSSPEVDVTTGFESSDDSGPKFFTETVELNFNDDKKTPLRWVKVSHESFLKIPSPEYFVHIRLKAYSWGIDYNRDLFAAVRIEPKEIVRICLTQQRCVEGMTTNYWGSGHVRGSSATEGLKPQMNRGVQKWYTTGFDDAFLQNWKGELSPVCVVVADSGIDYNHPLIASHLDLPPERAAPTAGQKELPTSWLFRGINQETFLTYFSDGGYLLPETSIKKPIHNRVLGDLSGYGLDLLDDTSLPYDAQEDGDVGGHGTAVSSVVFHGSQKIKIRAIRVPLAPYFWFYETSGKRDRRWKEYLAKIRDFVKQTPCPLVNFSWGQSVEYSEVKTDAIIDLMRSNADRLFFTAGGNGVSLFFGLGHRRNDRDNAHYPSAIPIGNNISVGSWDPTSNEISSFSTEDEALFDILAPGQDIAAANAGGHDKDSGFDEFSGTSFSSPWALNVSAKILMINPSLPVSRVREILLGTMTDDLVVAPRAAYVEACRSQSIDVDGCIAAVDKIPDRSLGGPAEITDKQHEESIAKMGWLTGSIWLSGPIQYDINLLLSGSEEDSAIFGALNKFSSNGIDFSFHPFLFKKDEVAEIYKFPLRMASLADRVELVGLREIGAKISIQITPNEYSDSFFGTDSFFQIQTNSVERILGILEFLINFEEISRIWKSGILAEGEQKSIKNTLLNLIFVSEGWLSTEFPFRFDIDGWENFCKSPMEIEEAIAITAKILDKYPEILASARRSAQTLAQERSEMRSRAPGVKHRLRQEGSVVVQEPVEQWEKDYYQQHHMDLALRLAELEGRFNALPSREIGQTFKLKIDGVSEINHDSSGSRWEISDDNIDHFYGLMSFVLDLEEVRQIWATGDLAEYQKKRILTLLSSYEMFSGDSFLSGSVKEEDGKLVVRFGRSFRDPTGGQSFLRYFWFFEREHKKLHELITEVQRVNRR